jgi:hypothetical protein
MQNLENHLYVIDPVRNKNAPTTFKPFNFTQTFRKVLLPEMMIPDKNVLSKRKNISKSSNQVNQISLANSKDKKERNNNKSETAYSKSTANNGKQRTNLFEKTQNFHFSKPRSQVQKAQSAKESSPDLRSKQFKAQPFNAIQVTWY